MACFDDAEIAAVLSEKLLKQITAQQVKEKRDAGGGIKQIDSNVGGPQCKIQIAERLCQNLLDKYKKERSKAVFERPVFKATDKIVNLANSSHPPVNREIELENKEYIKNQMLSIIRTDKK